MNNRFGSGAIASLIACIVVAASLSVINASATSARGGPHFQRVAAFTAGTVSVTKLPAPRGAHTGGLHPFRPVSTLLHSRPSAVPVVTAGGMASSSADATPSTEQVLSGFTGVTLSQQVAALGNDQAVTPPDPQIAAGPQYLLEMVNSSGTVWTKSGSLVKIFDLNAFFQVPSGYTFSDPRLLYDALSGRWFASGVAFVTPSFGSVLVFAVSATDDPSGAWTIYSADNNPNVTHDQPKIGVSTDKFAISFNDFLNAAFFEGASTWVFGKAAMLQGLSNIPGEATGPDSSRVSIVPAIELSATATEYMTYNNSDCGYSGCNAGYPSVGLVSLTGDASNGTLAWSEADPAIAGTSQPPAADQPGLPGSIQTNDDRFLTTVFEDGLLWTVGNDGCTPAGDTAARPCPRLIQLSTTGSAVDQNFDLGATGRDLYYPAVHMDSADNMFIVYNISSTSDEVGVRITGQPAGSPPQVIATPQTIQPGQGLYTCFTRWGDYNGAALDPATPNNVWVVGEYAGASSTNCEWATFVAQLTFASATPAPDFSLSASPTSRSIPRGGSTTYTITINQLNGFTAAVSLGVSGLPNRSSGSFSPDPATTSSVLTVTTGRRTPSGTYTLTITGTSGGTSHSIPVTLQVT